MIGLILIVILLAVGYYSFLNEIVKSKERQFDREEVKFKRDSLEVKLLEKQLEE